MRTATGSTGLSDEDLAHIRSLLASRDTLAAETWLVQHGFGQQRAKQIIFQQELEVSDAIYTAPVLAYLAIGAVGFFIVLLIIGMANTAEYQGESDAFKYEGTQRTLALAAICAVPFIFGVYFTSRAVLNFMANARNKVRFRRRTARDPFA